MSNDTICTKIGGNLTKADSGTEYCTLPDTAGNSYSLENAFCDQRIDYVTVEAAKEDLPKIVKAMGLSHTSSFFLCADLDPSKLDSTGHPVLGLFRKDLKTNSPVRTLADGCEGNGLNAETCNNLKKVADENPMVAPDSLWAKVEDGIINGGTFGIGMGVVTGAYLLLRYLFKGPKDGGGGGGGGGGIDYEKLAAAFMAAAAAAAKNGAPSTPTATSPQSHELGAEVPLTVAAVVAVEVAPSFLSGVASAFWGGVSAVGEGAAYVGRGALFLGEGAVNVAGAAGASLVFIPESMFAPEPYDPYQGI